MLTFGDGWVRTGDLGYLDKEGFLYLTDRRSDVIRSGGHRVSSLAVEAALHECPAVAEGAVVGMPHDVLGEYVVAVVALRIPSTAGDIKRFLSDRLPPHAVPATVVFIDRLPRGVSGKPLKKEIRAQLSVELMRPAVAPRTPLEKGIAEIWATILGLQEVGIHDRFAELGGQSLSAVAMIAEVNRRFRTSLQLRVLTEAETIAALAALVETRASC